MLKIKSDIHYKYNDLEKDLYRLCHKYKFYDDKDTLFYEIILNNHSSGKSDNNILYVNDEFYIKIKNSYNKIKIVLTLERINPRGTVSFNLEHINDNFANITYLDRSDISLKIDKNENNISSNLININLNEDNMAYNLSEIDNIKNNTFKSYLKNICNILSYNKKLKSILEIHFMKKYLMLMLV